MTDDPYVDEETGLLPPVPPLIPAVSPPPDIGEFDEHPGDDQTSIVIEALPGDLMQPMPVAPSMSIPEGFETPIGPAGGLTGEDRDAVESAEKLVGHYEAFLARVKRVYYAGIAHTVNKFKQVIDFERVVSWYDTNNEPKTGVIGPTNSRPVPRVNVAYPFPLRHDQAEYIVAEGDIVTIIQGEYRSYYMVDELPFLGQVMSHVESDYLVASAGTDGTDNDTPATMPSVSDKHVVGESPSGAWASDAKKVATWNGSAWTFASATSGDIAYAADTDKYFVYTTAWAEQSVVVTEAANGGAGVLSLRVIRKALASAPASKVASGFSDLQDADSVDVEYEHVIPVGPAGSAHGLRCGDMVWVQRRGRYFFCLAVPRTFVAQLQVGANKDPTGALADFTTSHYWFKEMVPTISYTTNSWTVTWAALTQTDPTGSGGRYGRWGDALNLAETAAKHDLADLDLVVVSEVLDSTAPAGVGYVFSRSTADSLGLTTTPAGVIWIWSGAIVDIPAGWVICDGNNSTPDLRNNFIVGAGDTYAVDATGGATTHTHTAHTAAELCGVVGAAVWGWAEVSAGEPTLTHNSPSHLPPYYALAYIMKT